MTATTMGGTSARVRFELNENPAVDHPYDQIKDWIAEHQLTHLEVTTRSPRWPDHEVTTTGEIEIVEGSRCAPGQLVHIASVSDKRAIVVTSPLAWPDQIDQPPFEHPVYINPRIIRIVGLRKD